MAATEMRIVQLINPAMFGGIETVVTELAKGLHDSGASVLTVAVVDQGADTPRMVDELSRLGVAVDVVSVQPRRYLREIELIARSIRRFSATVVHSHGSRMDTMARYARRRAAARWVSTLHGFCGGDLKNRAYEYIQLRSVRDADTVVAVSRSVHARALQAGVRGARLMTIPNAAPPLQPRSRAEALAALGLGPQRRWIGWVGRLSVEKDPILFAQTIRALAASGFGGVVVGDGPLLSQLKTDFDDLIREGRLVLAGRRTGSGTLMAAFDALLVTSVTEGTPMVVLEAMNCGVPVVSTSVGGVPDMIEQGAGVLVAERTVTALADAVIQLLNNAQAVDEVVRLASERLESRYSSHSWVSEHLRLYSQFVPVAGESST